MNPVRADLLIDGQVFETLRWGPPPDVAPTLVFLHDGLGSARLWRDFPARLAASTGLGALAYSRLGYGESSPCALPRRTDYMEEEAALVLPRLLEAAGLREFFLFGHSDGGSIALLYALGNPAPGLLGVITEAAHVFCEEVTLASIRLAAQDYEHGGLREKLLRHHGPNVDFAFGGWSGMWLNPAFADWDFRGRLSSLACPLLAVQGEEDEYGTAAQLEALGTARHSRILLLPGCGHTPHREAPEASLSAAKTFLTRASGIAG